MDMQTLQGAMAVSAVAAVKELVVNPIVRFLHRKGVLHGPLNPPFLSLRIRWRNIWVFLAFTAVWLGLIWGVPQLLGLT